jgi:hypothetical protein
MNLSLSLQPVAVNIKLPRLNGKIDRRRHTTGATASDHSLLQ